ncbi:MAG: hypothetical protein AAF125_02170 [Chloroflexota bacterium]
MTDDPSGIDCWVCPNCGQMYFGDDPPDMCDYCEDFTTWRAVVMVQPSEPQPPYPNEKTSPTQPRLFD